jgi:hypothetical protein
MRKLTLIAAAAMLAATASAAWPLTVDTQLSPNALSANGRSFTIATKDVGEFTQYDVTMTVDREGRALSPFVRGDLSLNAAGEHVALVRLEPQREDGKIHFWFRVSPAAIAGSRFEIGEQAYEVQRRPDGTPLKDERGQPRYEQIIGGWQYGFLLRDFARTGSDKSPR